MTERRTRRLARFAAVQGMQFALEPAQRRREPAALRVQDRRTAVGWFGVPGPRGFEVGQHLTHLDFDDGDGAVTRWTWGVFTLRAGPGSRDLVLRLVEDVLPYPWNAELSGNELVIYSRGWMRLRSRKLWRLMSTVGLALDPLLAQPARTSQSAERQRRRIHPSIEQ